VVFIVGCNLRSVTRWHLLLLVLECTSPAVWVEGGFGLPSLWRKYWLGPDRGLWTGARLCIKMLSIILYIFLLYFIFGKRREGVDGRTPPSVFLIISPGLTEKKCILCCFYRAKSHSGCLSRKQHKYQPDSGHCKHVMRSAAVSTLGVQCV
jgi:hypothetical protein